MVCHIGKLPELVNRVPLAHILYDRHSPQLGTVCTPNTYIMNCGQTALVSSILVTGNIVSL